LSLNTFINIDIARSWCCDPSLLLFTGILLPSLSNYTALLLGFSISKAILILL